MPSPVSAASAIGAGSLAVAWVAAALLVAAGVAKLRTPTSTSRALRLAGLPDDERLVRALGAGEVALGAAALVAVPLATLGVGLAYVAFTLFAVRQRRDPAADCGCFGTDATPLTRLHVTVDAVLAAGCLGSAALASAAIGGRFAEIVGTDAAAGDLAVPGPVALVGAHGVTGAVLAAILVVTGAWLVRVLLVDLPRVSDHVVRSAA